VVPTDRRSGAASTLAPDTLLPVLRAAGAPVRGLEDVPGAIRAREEECRGRAFPPVLVAWDGRPDPLVVRLPEPDAGEPIRGEWELEDGERRPLEIGPDRVRRTRGREVGGVPLRRLVVRLPGPLPAGYHRLRLSAGSREGRVLVISAPERAWSPDGSGGADAGTPGTARRREWGVFLPLFALREDPDLGVGDLGGLERLAAWADGLGADWVATLPLLPQFLDRPLEASPYAPVSRLFWNELYLDPAAAARRLGTGGLAELIRAAGQGERARRLEGAERVDYREAGRLKRGLLDALVPAAREAGVLPEPVAGDPGGEFLSRRPARSYARFRAACERKEGGFRGWSPARAPGELRPGRDFDPDARDRHLLAQWLLAHQLEGVDRATAGRGGGLYLDFPLSAHAGGFDAWRHPDLFASGVSLGAPPDAFFQEGQDWGFPPQHPERMRRTGYRHFRACLAHHMEHAAVLRVDHMMRVHRLYWIPSEADARHGAYVRYPAREMYAILSLESHRHRTALLGEDLGTVPDVVRREMGRHGLRRSWVLPFELDAGREPPFPAPPEDAVASLNTHDLWPFAAWWGGEDIDARVRDGEIDAGEAERLREERGDERAALLRQLRRRGRLGGEGPPEGELDGEDAGEPAPEDAPPPREVLAACLEELAASDARAVLVNLEDLFLETRPPNHPGRPERSWRRRARFTLAELAGYETAGEILGRVARARSQARDGDSGPTASGPVG
jgi:4-alpha-glucanotransferase